MPARRVLLLPQAERDLDDETLYLAEERSIEVGIDFFDSAHRTFQQLLELPGIGKMRDISIDRLNGLRQWRITGFESYLVFYRVVPNGIEIVRVLHGARDIGPILEQSGYT